jgi:hypothetical protein
MVHGSNVREKRRSSPRTVDIVRNLPSAFEDEDEPDGEEFSLSPSEGRGLG